MRWLLVLLFACGNRAPRDPGPSLQIVGESTRTRLEDPFPSKSPWFDGTKVTLLAARGETLGIQVLHRTASVTLAIDGATVRGYNVSAHRVTRPSTEMYGGSHGRGTYADGLAEASPVTTQPAYFEIVAGDTPGVTTGELVVGDRELPVELTIARAKLPPLERSVWAYEDPRELGATTGAPNDAERACIAKFREYGVFLFPDIPIAAWEARAPLVDGFRHLPVVIPTDPAKAGDAVRAWIEAVAGKHIPFTIPIDEPRSKAARERVRALADAVRDAGGGSNSFRYAVTDAPRAEYGDKIDLYVAWSAAHLAGDPYDRWTYNGAPPYAGSLVLDAETPGTRTWGWIMWRWRIPFWYVWDALYWHDRHNKKGAFTATDSVTFDDGEDHGNFDGVLALPGCQVTLRLAALRRGLVDRQLLDLAAKCAPQPTSALAAEVMPRALADAKGSAAWSRDEGAWEIARRKLVELASCDR